MSSVPALNQIDAGDADDPSRDMSNWNAIRDVVNGNLDTTNLSPTAGILASQTSLGGTFTPPTSYSPVIYKNDKTTTLSATLSVASYMQIGKLVVAWLRITGLVIPSGNNYYFDLPVPASNVAADRICGFGEAQDNGTPSAGEFGIASGDTTKGFFSHVPASGWSASGNAFVGTMIYPAA